MQRDFGDAISRLDTLIEETESTSLSELVSDYMTFGGATGFEIKLLPNKMPVLIRKGSQRVVSVFSGFHGDERAGPIFLRRVLRSWASGLRPIPAATLVIAPLINDEGWKEHDRYWNDKDLNRAFRDTNPDYAVKLISPLMSIMRAYRPFLHWDLHEDSRSDDPFVYDYAHEPHDMTKRLADYVGSPVRKWSSFKNRGSEIYARELGTPYAVTTETTPNWPLHRRMAWLSKAYDFLMRFAESPESDRLR